MALLHLKFPTTDAAVHINTEGPVLNLDNADTRRSFVLGRNARPLYRIDDEIEQDVTVEELLVDNPDVDVDAVLEELHALRGRDQDMPF